jgi:NADPH:quinone reductase-like Zn-dependent oxidoreductase
LTKTIREVPRPESSSEIIGGGQAGETGSVACGWTLLRLNLLPIGKHARLDSINLLRAQHSECFKQDLEKLFSMPQARIIQPRVAERMSFDGVADAHRRESGGLTGKVVLVPVNGN